MLGLASWHPLFDDVDPNFVETPTCPPPKNVDIPQSVLKMLRDLITGTGVKFEFLVLCRR